MEKGLKKLTEKQKEMLRELVDRICEWCKEHEDQCGKLTPHRLKRGNEGGLYIPSNIKMICNECHKQAHGGEYKHISG